ncbi:hypothetical protein A8924_4687 [Saccharopolyspora erythraea NRRL 2338]|uniref:Uncharacterized protein n=1 Tax=Saccharopolyspora erythraea TaxID=1836 RepID=A0ABN1C622_SACER|nr:hypothetical protein A8924_4687 [Saccharopolyspora erythraea NRRL 2338]
MTDELSLPNPFRTPKKNSSEVTKDHFLSDSRYFVDMSVPLTGFDPIDLQATGMTELFLRTLVAHAGPTPALQLFKHCAEAKKQHSTPFKLPAEADLAELACAVTKMWYLGAWYGVSAHAYAKLTAKAAANGEKPAPNEQYMVSADSYVEGLLWRLTGGHVPGAKPTGFGSWAKAPAPIAPTPTGPYKETA